VASLPELSHEARLTLASMLDAEATPTTEEKK